jgi:hypothetical protein
MRRHLTRLLERTSVLEVGGDAGAPEGVVAHFGGDACRPGPRCTIFRALMLSSRSPVSSGCPRP